MSRRSPAALARRVLVAAAILAALAARVSHAAPSTVPAGLDAALRDLAPLATSGVLADRVLPLARLEDLDGADAAPAVDAARWTQAWDELRRASLVPPAWPEPAALVADAHASVRAGVLPLALLDRAYDRVRRGASADGTLRLEAERVVVAGADPLVASRAVAMTLLAPPLRHGEATFALDRARMFLDPGEAEPRVAIDFDDGAGPRAVAPGERVHVRWSTAGTHVATARITRGDGSSATARFAIEVAALAAPLPDDTLHVTATIPYAGAYGTGNGYVALAPGHAALVNPVIVVEGFDLDNSMGWDELYALLDQQNLIETLRADGFDAVVLDFTDATLPVQENAFVVAELIQQVQAAIDPSTSIAVVGASMGALCSRYALAYMEGHALPHRVRTWISFDGPHAGADIPLGLQYWISFFSSQSASAASFLATLQRPAARQLLLYHLTSPASSTASADPLRATMLADFAAAGNWPQLPRRVAIANGSGERLDQGFTPAAQLIRYEYSSLFVSITGNVWAVPNQVSAKIFDGSTRILFSTTSQAVTVNNTLPWDGAPGGSRASMAQLDTTAAPYGDIVALHPSHDFIPTVSALAIPTSDPFFDVAGTPGLAATTPFDAVYFPAVNQEHVMITAENAAWVLDEIERGVLAAPPLAPAAASLRLTAGPNPFRAATRLAWALPAAGRATLRIHDAAGRLVRTLRDGAGAAGPDAATWDGRDERGARVAPGLYFARLATPAGTLVRRLVRLD